MHSTLFPTLACAAALLMWPAAAVAQQRDTTTGPVLTLEEAIRLAVRNNPEHLQVVNNRRTAHAALRSAYGSLLPEADVQFSSQYRQQGNQPIQGVTFSTASDVYQSSYSLGLNYRLSGASFIAPRLQSANLVAAEADILGSRENTRGLVAQQYLTALQSRARADLQDSLVVTAETQLALARAKLQVGSGTSLDVARAEVDLGQLRVAALQAHNQVEIDKLRLFQHMGVQQPENVRLVDTFVVSPPPFALDSVLELARRANPSVEALRSRERVASLGVRSARSEYLPSLFLSTGWGGYTYELSDPDALINGQRFGALQEQAQCFGQDSLRRAAGLSSITGQCAQIQFTDAQAAALRARNSQFPFNFTKQPFGVAATLSLPIFNGFQREQRLQEAEAQRGDARYRVRAAQLELTADVTAAYLTLTTSVRTVALQEQNAAKAREELRLAEERFRVGASSSLEVSQARASFERAETDRINAIYEYHKVFAALERAVGRPLR